MKFQTNRMIIFTQIVILLIFLLLTVVNEIIDIPHYFFGDPSVPMGHRIGEIVIEVFVFIVVIFIEIVLLKRLLNRIRILEGYLPICAHCKKIRHEGEWRSIESYISDHSHAQFSHSICPECKLKFYPDLNADT